MASWREHQAEVAEFFRSLGLEVRTDERLKGLQSIHDIDVVVRGQHVGLHQLWLVECKHWSLPVGKVNVAALAAIVRDVGADRGLLLSDTGFQAGAIQLAERSQVTLTSLEELHEQSTGELLLLTLARFRRRLARLVERLAPLSHAGRHSADINAVRPQRGVDIDAVLRLHVALGTAENGLQQADATPGPCCTAGTSSGTTCYGLTTRSTCGQAWPPLSTKPNAFSSCKSTRWPRPRTADLRRWPGAGGVSIETRGSQHLLRLTLIDNA